MPELPEAETIVRGLRPRVEGGSVHAVEVIHSDLLREGPEAFAARIRGRTVTGMGRRGKNILLHLSRADDEAPGSPGRTTLVVNLGMTGRLLPRRPADGNADLTHPGVVFHLAGSGGTDRLVYHDVRRFGELFLLDRADFRAWSRGLGPEPLSRAFTARRLAEALGRTRSPVRSWLLDQRRVAGVGNIYAVEALHRAGIHPARRGLEIGEDEVRRLHRALRRVLREAIRLGGTTIRDYRNERGDPGSYAPRLLAYGREGEPCIRCRMPIERIVLSNRSAYFCPRCQPPPARGGP